MTDRLREARKALVLDVEQRPDWTETRGQQAYLVAGPFGFGVATQDGGALSFTVRVCGWSFGWGVESPRWNGDIR
jgi:hypothetical protein